MDHKIDHNITLVAYSLPDAYHYALEYLKMMGDIVDCPDWNTKCKELDLTFTVTRPLQEPMISKCFIGSHKELQQYCMEMLDGILDFEVDKGKWKYTYHKRMVDYHGINQIDFVINELKRNPQSRRAVILIRNEEDIYSDDPACLQHIQYFIKNNKLECKVLFRSNDACKATFMNAFALILLQKKIADALGVEVGPYAHSANSFHCYEKDFDLLKGYCQRITIDNNLAYNYEGDWKEEMEEYIPEILETVEKLKRKD